MTKTDAMESLGVETLAKLADVLGITPAAVSQWPEELPPHAIRRVESVLYRKISKGARNHVQRV